MLKKGYNMLTEQYGNHKEMLMDIGVFNFEKDEYQSFLDENNESAFLLLTGKIEMKWNGVSKIISRNSVFLDKPICLHIPKNIKVDIISFTNSEVLIQKTENSKDFSPVFYDEDSITQIILGDDLMQNTARRVLRDIFNYSNAPYSNMVMGEVITLPGRWSSYPPHHHPQPEVYYYKFDKPQGFGVSIIGENATIVHDNTISSIPGGLVHPQVAAPGYSMYYCWMIRHLMDNPWNSRIDDEAHTWLHNKNADIFDI